MPRTKGPSPEHSFAHLENELINYYVWFLARVGSSKPYTYPGETPYIIIY